MRNMHGDRIEALRLHLVTPEMAAEWLEIVPDDARPLLPQIVARYAGDMSHGRWNGGASDTVILSAGPDGGVVVINGRHRLSALVRAGKPQQLLVEWRDGYSTHALMLDRPARRHAAYVLDRPKPLVQAASYAIVMIGAQTSDALVDAWCSVLEPIMEGLPPRTLRGLGQTGIRFAAGLAAVKIGAIAKLRYLSLFGGSPHDQVTARLLRTAISRTWPRADLMRMAFAHLAAPPNAAQAIHAAQASRMLDAILADLGASARKIMADGGSA